MRRGEGGARADNDVTYRVIVVVAAVVIAAATTLLVALVVGWLPLF